MFRLFYLPPYSPELNPDEPVWNHLKSHKIGYETIEGNKDFQESVRSIKHSLFKKSCQTQRIL
jgi:transposase